MEVRAFLGLAGYYRHHGPDLSTIARPLMELTTKHAQDKVVWTDKCKLAFHHLKEALTMGTVLHLQHLSERFCPVHEC